MVQRLEIELVDSYQFIPINNFIKCLEYQIPQICNPHCLFFQKVNIVSIVKYFLLDDPEYPPPWWSNIH